MYQHDRRSFIVAMIASFTALPFVRADSLVRIAPVNRIGGRIIWVSEKRPMLLVSEKTEASLLNIFGPRP